MDTKSKESRSANMRAIHSGDTKPELMVRRLLFAEGFRFRLHVKTLTGKPDIVLRKYRTAVFVNGCFWHAHRGCPHAKFPSSNEEFWKPKFEHNRLRDQIVRDELLAQGWRVLIVWECACMKKFLPALKQLLADFIRNGNGPNYAEIERSSQGLIRIVSRSDNVS